MMKWLLMLLILVVGCIHHQGRAKVYLTGINLGWIWNVQDVKEVASHHPRVVRIPARPIMQDEIFHAVRYLRSMGIMPLIVFDGAKNELAYKEELMAYMKEFGANICYEVLNEPLAMSGSPGYFKLNNPTQVVNFMNYWIDFIHDHIGNTSVLSCGIANVFEGTEEKLLKLVIEEGHQNILSLHIYTCNQLGADKYAPIIKKWKGPIWITEAGTQADKMTFYRGCLPLVYQALHPAEVLYFDWNSKDYGLKGTELWKNLF